MDLFSLYIEVSSSLLVFRRSRKILLSLKSNKGIFPSGETDYVLFQDYTKYMKG